MASNPSTEHIRAKIFLEEGAAMYTHCSVQLRPDATIVDIHDGEPSPDSITSKEAKHIQKAYLNYLLSPRKDHDIIRIDSSRALLRDLASARDSDRKEVLLVVYEVRGEPPSKLDEIDLGQLRLSNKKMVNLPFSRFSLPKNHSSGLRWRWTKVMLVEPSFDEAPIRKQIEAIVAKLSPCFVRMYRMTIVSNSTDVTYGTLVEHAEQSDNLFERQACRDAVNAIIKDDFQRPGWVIDGHRIYELVPIATSRGIAWCEGTSVVHRNSRVGTLSYTRSPILKPFLVSGSVATFMLDHFIGQRNWMEETDALNKILRGIKVKVRVHKSHETKTITSVSSMTPSLIADTDKHAAWSLKSPDAILHTHLPCINVGTVKHPSFLPPELCTIIAGQHFTGPSDSDLQGCTVQAQELLQEKVKARVPRDLTDWSSTFKEGFAVEPNVLFVEVGQDPIQSTSWDKLRSTLLARVHDMYSTGNTQAVRTLALNYQGTTEPDARWAEQLDRFLRTNGPAEALPGQETVLVVCLRAEKSHAQAYKSLKAACDVTYGAQTIMVNLATLEAKVRKTAAKEMVGLHKGGVWDATSDVIRRMRLRNPGLPGSPSDNTDMNDLAIAMLVTRVSLPSMSVDGKETGSCHKHFIVLVS